MKMTDKISIVFFSKSMDVFDTIPDSCFSKWNFHLFAPDEANPQFDRVDDSQLLIVDTYTLGMKFLEQLKSEEKFKGCATIVIDSYDRGIFIDDIVRKWAKGYLPIHRFSEDLERAIEVILGGGEYRSEFLEDLMN